MINEEIASELKLHYTRNNSQMLIEEAKHTQMSHEEFLTRLLESEYEQRRENGVKNRIRYAKFPYKKYSYVSFDKEGCEILFNLIFNLNDKGSIIIINTNLAFDR